MIGIGAIPLLIGCFILWIILAFVDVSVWKMVVPTYEAKVAATSLEALREPVRFVGFMIPPYQGARRISPAVPNHK